MDNKYTNDIIKLAILYKIKIPQYVVNKAISDLKANIRHLLFSFESYSKVKDMEHEDLNKQLEELLTIQTI